MKDVMKECKPTTIDTVMKIEDVLRDSGLYWSISYIPETKSYSVFIDSQPTIYYAHHQWKYGTKIEEYELELIKKQFPHALIFNPATELNVDGRTEEDIMNECLEIVDKSDIVIFSAMDGMIGIGVYNEVMAAKEAGKLVLCLTQNKLHTAFSIYDTPEYCSDRLYARVCVPMFK